MATFSLATSFSWKDRDGREQERTEWHRVVAWGPLGEICGQYLSKGSQVYIEGRIQSREWEDQDGNRRTTVEVVANDMIMLGGRGGGGDRKTGDYDRSDEAPRKTESGSDRPKRDDRRYEPPPPEDDIPF